MKETIEIHNEQDKRNLINRIQKAVVNKPWKIQISFLRDTRSNKQNRLYWLWIKCIIDFFTEHTGQVKTKREIDAWLLDLFAPVEEFEVNGKTFCRPLTTSDIDTYQMSIYLGRIDTHCASEFDLILPHPDDLYYKAVIEQSEEMARHYG